MAIRLEKKETSQNQNANNNLNNGLIFDNQQNENNENQGPRPATIRMFIEQNLAPRQNNNNNQHTR